MPPSGTASPTRTILPSGCMATSANLVVSAPWANTSLPVPLKLGSRSPGAARASLAKTAIASARTAAVSARRVGKAAMKATLTHLGDRGEFLTFSGVSGNLPLVQTYQGDAISALGDPTRRAIFERLADGPRPVGELAQRPTRQPPGRLTAPARAEGGRPRLPTARPASPAVPAQPGGHRRPADLSRSILGQGSGRLQGRGGATRKEDS